MKVKKKRRKRTKKNKKKTLKKDIRESHSVGFNLFKKNIYLYNI